MANHNAAANLSDDDRSKGGKMAHQHGAHEFNSEEAREAGQKSSGHPDDHDEHVRAGKQSHNND